MIGIPRSISSGKNTAMTIPTEGFQSNLEASNMRRNAGGPGGQRWNIGASRATAMGAMYGAACSVLCLGLLGDEIPILQ